MNALELKDCSFGYSKDQELFHGLNLQIPEGSCTVLTGPSGCGKSTICYLFSGIIPREITGIFTGSVLLFGKPITEYSLAELVQNVGIVFQNPDTQLFSPTIEDEIAFGPENLCLPKEEIRKRVEEALELIGMKEYKDAGPNELSGGQKQLVALASVYACRPKVYLFDEALSQLDESSKEKMMLLIQRLCQTGHTVFMVDHDRTNLWIADRVLTLTGGQCEQSSN